MKNKFMKLIQLSILVKLLITNLTETFTLTMLHLCKLELIQCLNKLRDFVNPGFSKAIYHVLFESHILYAIIIIINY